MHEASACIKSKRTTSKTCSKRWDFEVFARLKIDADAQREIEYLLRFEWQQR